MRTAGLINNAGLIQAEKDLVFSFGQGGLTNTNSGTDSGLIAKNGTLTITAGAVTNDGGYMGSGSTFSAAVSSWDNGAGTVASLGDLSLASVGAVYNAGTISAQNSLQLTGTNLTQAASGRLLGGNTLRVALTQDLVNAGFIDPTSTWILAAAITNTGSGTISGDSIFLNAGILVNGSSATISATDTLNIGAGAVTNQGAILSGGNMILGGSMDALGLVQGQAGQVANSGRMQAGGALGLAVAQGLDNSGSIYALGDVAVTAGGVSSSGLLASQGTLAISASSLSQGAGGTLGSGVDQHGNLITPAVGTSPDLLVFVQGGYNSQGAVLSAGKLSVQAGSSITQTGSVSTLGDQTWSGASLNFSGARVQGGGSLLLQDQGVFTTNGATIMAKSVTLSAAGLMNDASLIQAENDLTLSLGGGSLVNANSGSSHGLIAKSGNLAITAGGVTNNGGYMAAGNTFTAKVSSWDNGTGTATSLGNLSINSSGSINNAGSMTASGGMALSGTYLGLTRDASLTAGGTLRADISGTIDNRGLIDADFTWLTAQTLNNIGTGVIYGDRIALGAGTLNNAIENAGAAIASRGQLDIGAGTLNNQGVYDAGNHTATTGLILSLGDMAIGGGLDSSGRATGMGGSLINNGATIESMGNMSIAMGGIQNLNIHLAVTQVTRAPVPASTGPFETPFGWSFFTGTETDTEDVASEYNPGIIRSGGSMSINAGSILNKDSQILAGGDLSIQGAAIDNQATQGNRTAHYVGIITYGAGALVNQVPWAYDESTTIALTFQGYPVALSQGGLNMVSGGAPGQAGTGGMGNMQGMGATGSASMPFWMYGPGSILPQNSLYHINKDPGASVLIETDSRFTRNRGYLSSDYLLSKLNGAPTTGKRLGDGFYEQSLVRNQISQTTGKRFLDGYRNDEEQYRALLDAGASFGNAHNLQAGVALSSEMQAQLSQDIVWLVAEEVPLPDGTTTTALVPKFYSSLSQDDLAKAGGLIASDKNLAVAGTDIVNSGTIAGRDTLSLNANTIQNTGTLTGGVVAARTQGDFTQVGGSIKAAQGILLDVGRDLVMRSTVSGMNVVVLGGSVSVGNNIDRVSSMSVTGTGGIIDIAAGGKIGLSGAQIINGLTPGGDLGGTGLTSLTAGSIDLGTVGLSSAAIVTTGKGFSMSASSTEYGSSIIGSGSVRLIATGGDITLRDSAVASGSDTLLAALQGSIYLTPGQSVSGATGKSSSSSSSGFTSSTRSLAIQNVQVDSLGSVVTSQGDVIAVAKDTIEVNGSQIFGQNSTFLEADHIRNVASTDIAADLTVMKSSSTGVTASVGGVTFGTTNSQLTHDGVYAGSTPSVIGAPSSDVTIIAHDDYLQQGSNLLADTLYLKAKKASILAQPTPFTEGTVFKTSQAGLTLQVSNPIVNEGLTMWNTAQNMGQTSSSSALAAGGLTLGLAGKNAYDDYVRAGKGMTVPTLGGGDSKSPLSGTGLGNAVDSANSLAGSAGGLDISIKFGASQSQSSQVKVGMGQTGSNVLANTIVLNIGDPDNPNAQALTIVGSDVLASGDLFAKVIGNTFIGTSQSIQTMVGKNSSSGYSTGVGISMGNDGMTVYASASANTSQGKSSGDSLSNTYSHFGGTNLTSFDISGDLTMKGGIILGDRIEGNIDGNLTISSPQDRSTYNSTQTGMSAGAWIGWNLNTWSPRGGVNASVTLGNAKANYRSVGEEQAGITAGDGGFNITVGGTTSLTGAVISSSQKAVDKGLNYLSTNGLLLNDLENESYYNVNSMSLGMGYSPGSGNGFSGGLPIVLNSSSSDWGTTVSGISGGTIINNGQKVAFDSAGRPINTDVRTGDDSGKVENTFNLDEIKSQLAIGRALSQEAGTFLSNRAQELDAAQKAYNEEWYKGAQADPEKLAQLGKAADDAKQWGPGGTYRLVFTAITGGLTGNLGGSASQAMQSAVVTAVQGLGTNAVKGLVDNYEKVAGSARGETLRTALQAIVGCAGAAASGGNCGSGALGASASVVLNDLADLAASTNASNLTAQEKEARMNLVTSLVGGVTAALGGDTAAAVLAARVEQENNYAALLTLWPEIGAELPAIAQRLQQIAPGLAQLIFSVNANDGSGSASNAGGNNLFENPPTGQGGGSPNDPEKQNNKDTADKIANGHAFQKHVLDNNEFGGSITTKKQFADRIESVMNNPTHTGKLQNGRSYFYDQQTNTVVISNPSAVDGGTAFQINKFLYSNPLDYLKTLR